MQAPPEAGGGQQGGVADPRYKEAIGVLEEILKTEPDDQDSAQLANVIQTLYKIAADRQKEEDDMLAGKVSPRALRR